MKIKKPTPHTDWNGKVKLTWNFCDGECGTIMPEGQARFGGCGLCRCSGKMCWMDMTEKEFEVYKPVIEEVGLKVFAEGVHSGLYKSIQNGV